MFTTPASRVYHVAANGVPTRCYKRTHGTAAHGTLEEAFREVEARQEAPFELVF